MLSVGRDSVGLETLALTGRAAWKSKQGQQRARALSAKGYAAGGLFGDEVRVVGSYNEGGSGRWHVAGKGLRLRLSADAFPSKRTQTHEVEFKLTIAPPGHDERERIGQICGPGQAGPWEASHGPGS